MRRYAPTNTPRIPEPVKELPDFIERDLVAEIAPIDGSHWRLCLHPLHYIRQQNPDISTLLASDAASNPFFDPAFVNASRDRIAPGRIYQLIVWESVGEENVPRLVIPVVEHRQRPWQGAVLKSLTHPYAPLGAPLLKAAPGSVSLEAQETCERFLELMKAGFKADTPPLLLEYLPETSPIKLTLANRPAQDGLCVITRQAGNRAVILPGSGDPLAAINKKRMREYRRLENKLARTGELTYDIATDPMDILVRLEEFLLIEARGWKGRRGTSIHNIKRHAAFARQAICDLAAKGKAEIISLRVNDVAIASTLLIEVNGHYYPWKTTFNETYSRYSPGTLLMLWLTVDILGRDTFVDADSLAIFGQSWMTALWPDTTGFSTAVIAPDCKTADGILNNISRAQRVKSFVKRLLGKG